MRDRLRRWGTAPLVVPRWMLTVKYALFTLLGVVAVIAGIPSLDLTTSEGYTSVWAGALTITSATAATASVRERWETTEMWAALGLVSLLSAYAVSALFLAVVAGQAGRAAFAIILLITTLLPSTRAGSLIIRTGRPRE